MFQKSTLLCFAVFFQLCILGGEYLNSVYPLWVGKEVKFRIEPVDPRDLFRGQYVRLGYEINSLKRSQYVGRHTDVFRTGEVVYVLLESDGTFVKPKTFSLTKPESDLFIRGRIFRSWRHTDEVQVIYGIEAYFASPERAIALERSVRSIPRADPNEAAHTKIMLARVMIAPNGKASLLEIEEPASDAP